MVNKREFCLLFYTFQTIHQREIGIGFFSLIIDLCVFDEQRGQLVGKKEHTEGIF